MKTIDWSHWSRPETIRVTPVKENGFIFGLFLWFFIAAIVVSFIWGATRDLSIHEEVGNEFQMRYSQ